MRYILLMILFLIIGYAFAEDYVLQFQAKVKNLREFNISDAEKFRSYEWEGTFTDNFANYGKSNSIIVSDIKDGKILRLEGTNETTFSNNEKFYGKALREKSDIDAGIANILIVGATKKLKPLIVTKCIVSVKYFEDAIFGMQKCALSERLSDILKNNTN